LSKYFAFIKISLLSVMAYRSNAVLMSFSNLIYVGFIYFLWRSIYAQEPDGLLNGMSFAQTFVYLVGAATMFSVLKTWREFKMSWDIISGAIITDIVRPVDFQLIKMFESAGIALMNVVWMAAPLIIITFFFDVVSLKYLPFFMISVLFSFFISFNFDYIAGLMAFYTRSVWGVSTIKEMSVLFLSGALLPLSFYPEFLVNIIKYLPFYGIFNIPLSIFMGQELAMHEVLTYLLIQIFWVLVMFILGRGVYAVAIKRLTISGG
jgi:ABC-2 type transport system permease protein